MIEPSENQHDDFDVAKAFAHFDRNWKHCLHAKCKKRRRCTGGPRGTRRKTGGIPFCRLAGNCRVPGAPRSGVLEPDVPWGEEPPKQD